MGLQIFIELVTVIEMLLVQTPTPEITPTSTKVTYETTQTNQVTNTLSEPTKQPIQEKTPTKASDN